MHTDPTSDIWSQRRESGSKARGDVRDAASTDYGRIVHSASFRRLQGKTQILNLGDSDFYRNRLTHSIEVGQVAGGLAMQLSRKFPHHPAASWVPDQTMIQTAGAAHDLGHPPFGHGGEVALNYAMRDHGGFEGNGQTLRILSALESFSAQNGANLSRRSLLSILKYPLPYSALRSDEPKLQPQLLPGTSVVRLIDREACKPPKCYLDTEQHVVDWLLSPLPESDKALFTTALLRAGKHGKSVHKTFDCSIMDLADDIAFGVHDLEDALAMRLIRGEDLAQWLSAEACACFLEFLAEEDGNSVFTPSDIIAALTGDQRSRKHMIGRMVTLLISAVQITELDGFETPLLRFRATLPEREQIFLDTLKAAVREKVIKSAAVQHLEFKGQNMVVAVFEAMATDPLSLLPASTREKYEASDDKMRVVCDHIAGMTDAFLMHTYERLFSPRMGSLFDHL